MTQGKLVQAQLNESLTGLHYQAMDVVEVDKSPSFYYNNGLLMRFYRPPKCSSLDSWSEKRQTVVAYTHHLLIVKCMQCEPIYRPYTFLSYNQDD